MEPSVYFITYLKRTQNLQQVKVSDQLLISDNSRFKQNML